MLEGEGVADPGYHGQGPYSNSTIPPKINVLLAGIVGMGEGQGRRG